MYRSDTISDAAHLADYYENHPGASQSDAAKAFNWTEGEYNTRVNCMKDVHLPDRGLVWTTTWAYWRDSSGNHRRRMEVNLRPNALHFYSYSHLRTSSARTQIVRLIQGTIGSFVASGLNDRAAEKALLHLEMAVDTLTAANGNLNP